MADLKPCPFCGADGDELGICSEPDLNNSAARRIQCYSCNVEAPFYPDEGSAISAWNRRATDGQRSEPVAWFEAEESARGLSLREVLPSVAHSTRWHWQAERPRTSNPVWPVFADGQRAGVPARRDEKRDRYDVDRAYTQGWNACRDAMLAAAPTPSARASIKDRPDFKLGPLEPNRAPTPPDGAEQDRRDAEPYVQVTVRIGDAISHRVGTKISFNRTALPANWLEVLARDAIADAVDAASKGKNR